MELDKLLPPAVLLSILVYLINFFGKIIEDQNPFSDDKEWAVQISGIFFMLNVSVGLMGIFVAINYPWGTNSWWIHLITFLFLSFSISALYVNNLYLKSEYFLIDKNNIENLEKVTFGIFKIFSTLGNWMGIGILPFFLFYFATLEYLSKNIYWIIFFIYDIFIIFIFSALNFSLKNCLRQKITPVNIYFINKDVVPLLNARLLKINPDNIRLRKDNTIIVINKNEVLRIERVLAPEEL